MAKRNGPKRYMFQDLSDLKRACQAMSSHGFYAPHFSIDKEHNTLTLKVVNALADAILRNTGGFLFVKGGLKERMPGMCDPNPPKPNKAVKEAGKTYKVWVQIEELDADGNPTGNDDLVLPDSLGHYDNITDAMRQVARAVHAFGSDKTIETSDSVKGQRPNSCKKCGCDLNKLGYCQDDTCPYHTRWQHNPRKVDPLA